MALHSSPGLSSTKAAELLKEFGPNELPQNGKRSVLRVIFDALKEPMILLLLASAVLYSVVGDPTESIMLFASALVILTIDLVQEIRSDRALQALRSLASPRALVVRDGEPIRVPAADVVPGDALIVSEGDRVAADAELSSGAGLAADESLLTGESVPVEKSAEGLKETRTIFSGSMIVRGSGVGTVVKTGASTEIGKIGSVLATVRSERTPLQQGTTRLVRLAAIAGTAICILVIIVYGLTRGDWIEASQSGIALAISLLPEEFPVILSVFLALGARRLASAGMLVHHMPAVEALGTATVLCVDKTGTLTMNSMSLASLATGHGRTELEDHNLSLRESERHLLAIAQFATKLPAWDPMDKAVQETANKCGLPNLAVMPALEVPISAVLPAMINCYEIDGRSFVAVKGMPEAVLRLCKASPEQEAEVLKSVTEFARNGMRVLAVAESHEFDRSMPPEEQTFLFLGLLAFHDPIRPGVKDAVEQCYTAGMRVIMITGDFPITATSIARQAGIRNPEAVLTGAELRRLSADELAERMRSVQVCARITPIEKLRIVEALKRDGEVVAMTGDGVNDAPALKAAHIGVAMGARGTDVAREAASVILTGDDFPSLVTAIRLGRRTYDNIKKAMYYVLAMHVPIAGLSVLPLVLGLPMIFYPIHIVLLELIIDPMSSIVFESESEESNVMLRPPRDPKAPLFTGRNVAIALLQGLSVFAVISAVYLISLSRTHNEPESRTLAFATLIIANLMLALVNRSWARTLISMLAVRNKALWWCIGGGVALLLAITAVPALSAAFHLGPFHLHDWVLSGAAAAVSLTWFEILKLSKKTRLSL